MINKIEDIRIKIVKRWLSLGALICMLSIVIGAFAAHSLKASLNEYQLGIIDTAAQYQMYNGFSLIMASLVFLVLNTSLKKIKVVNCTFVTACVLFSGSLYCLAISNIKIFAYFTPLGGLLFIGAWALLIWAIYTSNTQIESVS